MGSNGKGRRSVACVLMMCVAIIMSACGSSEPVQAESTPAMESASLDQTPAEQQVRPGIADNDETGRPECVGSTAVTLGPSASKNQFINETSPWGEQYLEMQTEQAFNLICFIAGDDTTVATYETDGKLVPAGSSVNINTDNFVDPGNPSSGIKKFLWLTVYIQMV